MISPAELDEIVAGLKIEFPLQPEPEIIRSFKTFQELKSYFEDEARFWQDTGLQQLSNAYRGVLTALIQAPNQDPHSARASIVQALAAIRGPSKIINSSTAQAKFLKELSSRDSRAAKAAFHILNGTLVS